MPVQIKELVVKVTISSETTKNRPDNIDAKLKGLKADILKSCKRMIDKKSYGR
jgi:hypothetical protein